MSDSTPLPDPVRQTLACVLDTLIPGSDDGRLPGAGGLDGDGISASIQAALDAPTERQP